MSIIDWIQTIVVLLSAVAAILAWVAKIRWSQEYAQAKDEVIKSKDAQIALKEDELKKQKEIGDNLLKVMESSLNSREETIKTKDAEIEALKGRIESLQELNPVKIREYFLSMKEQLEEYNDKLKNDLQQAYLESNKKDEQIKALLPEREANRTKILELEQSRNALQTKIASLEEQIKHEQETLQAVNNATLSESDALTINSIIQYLIATLPSNVNSTAILPILTALIVKTADKTRNAS